MGLASGLGKYRHKASTRLDAIVKETVEAIGQRVVANSPRDTGLLQSNWFMGLDAPQLLTTDVIGTPELQGTDAMPTQPAGHRFFISNSLPYVARLEFGFVGPDALGRVYNQAGLGFAAAVGMEMRVIAEGVARKVAT